MAFSPLEEMPVGRNELDEDDENATRTSRDLQDVFPMWSPTTRSLFDGHSCVRPRVLFMSTCRLNCHMRNYFANNERIGTVMMPAISLRGNTATPGSEEVGCFVYRLDGEDSAVLAPMQRELVGHAREWAVRLLKDLKPRSVVILGGCQEHESDSKKETPQGVYLVETEAAREVLASKSNSDTSAFAPLPPGPLILGFAAAVVAQCELQSLPCRLAIVQEAKNGFASIDTNASSNAIDLVKLFVNIPFSASTKLERTAPSTVFV